MDSHEKEEVLKSKLTVKFLGEMLQYMRSITERLLYANVVMGCYLKFKGDWMLPFKELH